MNENTRKIYQEAIKYANSVVPENNRYNDIYYEIVSGKFAELIVVECLELVEKQYGGGNGDGVEWDRAIDFTFEEIQNHFEIEL